MNEEKFLSEKRKLEKRKTLRNVAHRKHQRDYISLRRRMGEKMDQMLREEVKLQSIDEEMVALKQEYKYLKS